MACYNARFTHQGARYTVAFRSTYDGRAFYDVAPQVGESMQIAVQIGRSVKRPDPRPLHYAPTPDRVELARAAYCAYRRAQRADWREWAPRKGFKNIGAMLRYARRG